MGQVSRTSKKSLAHARSRTQGDPHPYVLLAGRPSEGTAALGSGDHQTAGYRSSLAQAGVQGGLGIRFQLELRAGVGRWPRLDKAHVRCAVELGNPESTKVNALQGSSLLVTEDDSSIPGAGPMRILEAGGGRTKVLPRSLTS